MLLDQNTPKIPPSAFPSCTSSDCTALNREVGESQAQFEERRKLQSRLCRIKHKIVVLSGKGGVGKSTVAVNLAMALTLAGKKTGLVDVDIHGPSIPTMLGLEGWRLSVSGEDLLPAEIDGLKVLSIGFFMQRPDDAVVWRGPMKNAAIKQFLKDVAWGDLDYLIVDSPPGTGDEPLSVCQLIGRLDGAVIVTTPQRVAEVDVRKSVTFCRQMNLPILGIVENMSGFCCPKCGEVSSVFGSGGGQRIADSMAVPFLGSIPIDPQIAAGADDGRPYVAQFKNSATAKSIHTIIAPILLLSSGEPAVAHPPPVGHVPPPVGDDG